MDNMDKFATIFLNDPDLQAFLDARRFKATLPEYRTDIVQGVGLVVIAFQRLEMQLQMLILELSGCDPRTLKHDQSSKPFRSRSLWRS